MKRSDVLRLALVGALLVARPSSAFADGDVRVRVPQGVDFADATTSAAPDGQQYVTVTGLAFPNPSGEAQSYHGTDVHLLARDHVYLPVVRPHLGAIDHVENGIVGPRETLRLSATFLVPAGITTGDIEFTPHWIDDTGRTIDYCCYYE